MRAKQLTDWHSSTLTQWALAKFILDGCLIKHIRRCHGAYSSRRARLIEHLDGDLSPWFKRLPSHTGFHLAAFSKNTLDIRLLTELAKKAEIGLHPLAPYYHSTAPRSGLLLGFGAIETLDIETSLERLKSILKGL
jgi:GntR family transcriptional regulator/MocR family aminotransferase